MVKPISSGKRRGGSAGRRDGKVITVSSGISVGRGIDPTATHEGHGIDGLAIWKERVVIEISDTESSRVEGVNIAVVFLLLKCGESHGTTVDNEVGQVGEVDRVVIEIKSSTACRNTRGLKVIGVGHRRGCR